MQRHPLDRVALLASAGLTDTSVLAAVGHHHERMDGTGYRHKLAKASLEQLASMTTTCNALTALDARVFGLGRVSLLRFPKVTGSLLPCTRFAWG